MAEQIGLYDVEAESYAAFEDKFKPKLTTDEGQVRIWPETAAAVVGRLPGVYSRH